MSFIGLKGRTQDVRLDGALEYVRKMHETLLERLDQVDVCIDTVEEKYEHTHKVLSSVNRDIKALEAKPEPVIPIMPDLRPLRAEIAKLQALSAGHNDEMIRCLNSIKDVREKGIALQNSSTSTIMQRIDAIKIPKAPTLTGSYIWLSTLTLINFAIIGYIYVKL